MNEIEIVYGAICVIALNAYLWNRVEGIYARFVVGLASSIFLFHSIEGITQFLTDDEFIITGELRSGGNFSQYHYGGLRTSIILIKPILIALSKLSPTMYMNQDYVLSTIKLAHHFFGFCILVGIGESISRSFSSEPTKGEFWGIFWAVCLGFPVFFLNFKVSNYDLLSMLLGVLAIVLIAFHPTRQASIWAIVFSSLATQEKLIASPVLLLTIGYFVFSNLSAQKKENFSRIIPMNLLLAISIPLVVCTITSVLIYVLYDFQLKMSIYEVIKPTFLFLWPMLRIIENPIIWILLTLLLLLCIGIVYYYWDSFLQLCRSFFNNSYVWLKYIPPTFLFIGVLATYTVTQHIAIPSMGSGPFRYIPQQSFNGFYFHYDSANKYMHKLKAMGFSLAEMTNSFSMVIFLVVIALVVLGLMEKKECKEQKRAFLLLHFPFLVIILYGLLEVPTSRKYLNLFSLLILLNYTMEFLKYVNKKNLGNSRYITMNGVIFLVFSFSAMELHAFRPVIGQFIPAWNIVLEKYKNFPQLGEVYPGTWMGWGEESYLVDRLIADNETGVLYTAYNGTILNAKGIKFSKLDVKNPVSRLTADDLVVINRNRFIHEFVPDSVLVKEPVYTLKYRGFTQAWVYRASDVIPHTIGKFSKFGNIGLESCESFCKTDQGKEDMPSGDCEFGLLLRSQRKVSCQEVIGLQTKDFLRCHCRRKWDSPFEK